METDDPIEKDMPREEQRTREADKATSASETLDDDTLETEEEL